MARIDSAYAYYMSTYGKQQVSRYDSHKKSDLRKVYNSIVKSNTESPLYKIANMDDAKRYAIDIKENAKSIQNVVASLSDTYGEFKDSFRKKVAVSSDPENVSVEYVGDGTEDNSASAFHIEVERLASPQVNRGNYLLDDAMNFSPGTYSFDLSTNLSTYEFQFTAGASETNKDILEKLNHLINTSNLGVTSQIKKEANRSALEITSLQTGLSEQEKNLFSITPAPTADSMKAMGTLGIDRITEEAKNSSFLLNGTKHSSVSNHFTINNVFELSLNNATPIGGVDIGFKNDIESMVYNITTLTDAYNRILDTSNQYDDSEVVQSNKLFRDIASVSKAFREELGAIGIDEASNGELTVNQDALEEVLQSDDISSAIGTISKFKDAIGTKANEVAVNPMKYVEKVVVSYKNPGHNFATPYITSIYSGLMLDNYV